MNNPGKTTDQGLSIIIPLSDKSRSLKSVIGLIEKALADCETGEIIIADSNGFSLTNNLINGTFKDQPTTILKKKSDETRGQLLRRAFLNAKHPNIVLLDPLVQYESNQLAWMYDKIMDGTTDIVITERKRWNRRRFYHLLSWLYQHMVISTLFNLSCDTQSTIILFKREMLPAAIVAGTKKDFGLTFLWHAKKMGARISSLPVYFHPPQKSLLYWLRHILSLSLEALLIRINGLLVMPIINRNLPNQAGNGIAYKNKKFITHNSLSPDRSAFRRLTHWQTLIVLCLIIFITAAAFKNWYAVAFWSVAFISAVYWMDVILMFLIVLFSLTRSPEYTFSKKQIKHVNSGDLPVYTILCPLYKEPEVVRQFVEAMMALDWPADKLDIQLLVEKDDRETADKIHAMNLPAHFTVHQIPDGNPKTKPKACNYGLAHAKGEYVVIYDAEDIPEPDQLKKAYLAFQQADPEIVCLQAKLDYYNAKQNLLTRLFALEYNLWFGAVLPSLYALRAPIPLGGTSNHFRTQTLNELSGWDPFNVTEDCDLGIRLFSLGQRTGIIDSYTHEEANSQVKNWIRQRSRWIKGYLQTQLVAWRNISIITDQGPFKLIMFIIVFGHKSWSVFINPFLWLLTIGFFIKPETIKPITEIFFSGPIGYVSGFTLIVGNFLHFYAYMLAALRTKQWWMVGYTFLVPLYWLLMSVAGWYGLWQLITKPHYWEKTQHGLYVIEPTPEPVAAKEALKTT